jgi:hypothetical protein
MKNKDQHIEQEIEKTLDSLNKTEKIECRTFFHTRIMGNIESMEKKQKHNVFESDLIGLLRPTLLILIIILNIVTGIYFFRYTTQQSQERSQYIESLSEEFSIQQTNYTLMNNNEN